MSEKRVEIIKQKEKTYLSNERQKIISVCAYCRVSTDKNDQRNSFEAQKKFFEDEFERHDNWIGRYVFADKGISGTSLAKRDEFKRMIEQCRQGKYQLIVTKEVSRFSRNVQDIMNVVTELRDAGVYIIFLTDEINTEDANYRERLVKAGDQAEAESRKTSNRVKWGQRRQMEAGVVFGRREMLGYNIVPDENGKQHFQIIDDEAALVRRIFIMYSDGMGTFKIAKQLEQEGIKTKRLKNGWSNTVILRLLRNEKYVGDLLTGKTYTEDFLTHKKKYNRGDSDAVLITNHHPDEAIVSRELWDIVQRRLKENEPSEEEKSKHSNRFWCSGKIVCGECGERYVSHKKKRSDGSVYKAWKCFESQRRGSRKQRTLDTGEIVTVGCNSQSVNDVVLYQGMYDLLSYIREASDEFLQNIEVTFRKELKEAEKHSNGNDLPALEKRADENRETISRLTILFAQNKITEQAYNIACREAENELQKINDEIANYSTEDREKKLIEEYNRRITQIRSIIDLKSDEINESIFRSMLDKVIVYNDHILEYHLTISDKPIRMQYQTYGQRDDFGVVFTVCE